MQLHGPIGPERGDMHAAQIRSEISLIAGALGGKAFSPAELMPKWRDRPAVSNSRDGAEAMEGSDIAGLTAFKDWAVGMAQFAAAHAKK